MNFSEKDLSQAMDEYMRYVHVGIKHPSPQVRTNALTMLGIVASSTQSKGYIRALLMWDRLVTIATEDNTVEVTAQLIDVCCAVLANINTTDAKADNVVQLVTKLLTPDSSKQLQLAGVASLNRCLHMHPPLRELYMNIMLDDAEFRERVLSDDAAHAELWSPLDVAEAVEENVKLRMLENLEPGHVQMLVAAVEAPNAFQEADADRWRALFDGLREHIVVEFYDPLLCTSASRVLLSFLTNQITYDHTVQIIESVHGGMPPLFGIVKLILPDGEEPCKVGFLLIEFSVCFNFETPLFTDLISGFFSLKNSPAYQQANLEHFLRELAIQQDSDLPSLVLGLIRFFEARFKDKYNGSFLEAMKPEVERFVDQNAMDGGSSGSYSSNAAARGQGQEEVAF